MTIKEVISRLRYKAENIKAKLEQSYFSECADYLDKYRWHDLRKNPEDLPKDEGSVICAFDLLPSKLLYDICFYSDGIFDNEVDGVEAKTYQKNIVAWKEIETFEEVEE